MSESKMSKGDPDSRGRFVGEKIEVVCSDEDPTPLSFKWRGHSYVVTEIVRSWQDHGFSEAAPKRRTWLMRRHRNVYLVNTDPGGVFEIYLDRGVGRRNWYIYKQYK